MTGGNSGSSDGLLNRTAIELLENDTYLNSKKVSNSESFIAEEIVPILKVCKLSSIGMIVASNVSALRSSGLLALSLEPIETGNSGEFLLLDKVSFSHTFEIGATLYLGIGGAITTTEPLAPNYTRVIGHALPNSYIFFNPQG